jgi:two-component system sensor histidine kinase KdpD
MSDDRAGARPWVRNLRIWSCGPGANTIEGMRERLLAIRHRPAPPSPVGVGLAVAGLVVSTLLTAALQGPLGVRNAEIVYLLAVVAAGLAYGSWYAVGTAVAAFLAYDFLFITPLYTFQVGSPEQWLDLLLFLVVAIAIGHLGALQLQRRREAELRSSEARTLFAMSRDIATAATAHEAAPDLVSRLVREAQMTRVWIGLGPSVGEERVVADSSPDEPRLPISPRWVLHSVGGDSRPSWSRVHEAANVARPARGSASTGPDAQTVLRVPVEAGGQQIGSLWACRCAGEPFPGRSHSRLMAAAADQFGQAVVRDRLAAEATAVEVARQGDALKSALLDSVSHDLRTPLAAIRATAGHLMDPSVPWSAEAQRQSAESIDREADRLSRLVRNMLDLGRIEGGALRPALELYSLADLVEPAVERVAAGADPPAIEVDVPAGLPAVRVDAIFVDQILTNLIDNSIRHAGQRPIKISARKRGGVVDLVVEDGGSGVSQADLGRIFDRFYRAAAQGSRAAGGSGIGLAVVKGLAEAMGGTVAARRSRLGGLAVVVGLPVGESDEPGAAAEGGDAHPGADE